MKLKKNLSIIIPTHNYEKNIEKNIQKLYLFVKSFENNFEIIVVDDGSQDNTPRIIEKLKRKLSKIIFIKLNRNYGKGYAIRKAAKICKGLSIMYIDCDLPYLKSFKKMYFSLKSRSTDLAIISREKFKKKNNFKNLNRILFIFRKLLSNFIGFLTFQFIISEFPDTQAGLKGVRSTYRKKIFNYKTNGFLFDIEILSKAKKNNLKIKKFYEIDDSKFYTLSYVYNIKYIFNTLKDLIFLIIKKNF